MRWFGHGVKARHVGFANGSAPLAHGQLHRSPLSRVRSVPLGVDRYGQVGSLAAVYEAYDLSPEAIATAALIAREP